jgi:uncharacterized protein with NRDE domain
MCLILFSYNNHPKYKLILASNRDEFYDRPTCQLGFWNENQSILAGRDEKNNGTWLGVTQNWKLSCITNFRDPSTLKYNVPSRGLLVSDFLENEETPYDYLEKIRRSGVAYNGFNLITGDRFGLYYYTNMNKDVVRIEPGIHGLCNQFLNTPWPKVTNGKIEFERLISGQTDIPVEDIFNLLRDATCPPDYELPETGVGIVWERILAPVFINSETYGTRASSIILIDKNDRMTFIERTFIKTAQGTIDVDTVEYVL